MKPKLEYSQENGVYYLLKNGEICAELSEIEKSGVLDLIKDINLFLNEHDEQYDSVNIQNDGNNLGIIVDLYQLGNSEEMEHFITGNTYWFEDYDYRPINSKNYDNFESCRGYEE